MRRAFVVELSRDCEPGTSFLGRVEHIPSGEAIHFRSLSEFLSFLIHSINREGERDPDQNTGGDE